MCRPVIPSNSYHAKCVHDVKFFLNGQSVARARLGNVAKTSRTEFLCRRYAVSGVGTAVLGLAGNRAGLAGSQACRRVAPAGVVLEFSGDAMVVRRACTRLGRLLLVAASACAFAAEAGAAPLTFTVNSPADVPDVNPGDGVCETVAANGICTLRGAIQESNAHVGADTIVLQPNVTYLLARVGDDETALNGDLDILDSVTMTGAGPSTIIDGNGGALGERVFTFHRCIREPYQFNSCATGFVIALMSGLTIQHGYASNLGGGIYNDASLTLANCVVTANTVNGQNDWGGGIFTEGSLTLIGSVVSDNVSGSHNAYGGGIFNQGQGMMTIDSSTISGNGISGAPGYGGGIMSSSSQKTVIKNSTVTGNHAIYGGGIYMSGNNVAVINTTISGNYSDKDGAGVFCHVITCGLYNATVAQNQANADEFGAATGGGVFNESGTIYVANSIIAGNYVVIPTGGKPIHDPDQCSGTISSLGNNLLSDIDVDHCTMAGPYNVASLPLGNLQNNGGPTKTHALPSGSAAINAGNIAGCVDGDGAPIATDQRGVHRPYGPYCDVGAFEASDTIFLNGFEIGV